MNSGLQLPPVVKVLRGHCGTDKSDYQQKATKTIGATQIVEFQNVWQWKVLDFGKFSYISYNTHKILNFQGFVFGER